MAAGHVLGWFLLLVLAALPGSRSVTSKVVLGNGEAGIAVPLCSPTYPAGTQNPTEYPSFRPCSVP